ncbi:hypothetical protein CHLNCDRAFT_141944 [Chlorella variabilis]|uniref:Right handed beta helix domain-containing protein n=1 Tax=Chlorella variabilis TaxID=554065 RepID=E1Z7D6_CHLVA|nr:hypothetical protein CHLNCDRAFT_141944 [Chlorella variabilis]EFN57900.1 hypothetical protein CHLNCDRAFT_141944 [Chlorella variabilis]|eukprot:XP_005850002.1 hypothetical protein CHLNCDRAFT_141944 [Chlorella variabilis]
MRPIFLAACVVFLATRHVLWTPEMCRKQRDAHTFMPAGLVRCRVPPAAARTTAVALPDGKPYSIGQLVDPVIIWVDPNTGVDQGRTGTNPALPLKTFKAAWAKVPAKPTRPHRIRIKSGTFNQAQVGEWLEFKNGTYKAPIIVEAAAGATVNFNAYVSVRFCRYLYFIGIRINFGGDSDGDHPFHAEGVTGLLMRKVRVRGKATGTPSTREVVKFNQCKGVYVEQCDFAVATDNAIDAVAVQIYNNIIYDLDEAPAISVYGGYNILVAHNTLYRVGSDGSSLFSIRQGLRSCDDDIPEQCTAYMAAGGWGQPGGQAEWSQISIPNRNVIIANNLAVQPPAHKPILFHFAVGAFYVLEPLPYCHEYSEGPCTLPAGLPTTVSADKGLVIRGNVIWDGPVDDNLGIHDEPGWQSGGCRNSHPTCNKDFVRANNDINNQTQQPQLVNPAGGNFRLTPGSLPFFSKLWTIPKWAQWAPGGPSTPAGNLTNTILFDKEGAPRTGGYNAPGALVRVYPPDRH